MLYGLLEDSKRVKKVVSLIYTQGDTTIVN
jgi:hypothetical protein